jgi:hypothetical protein
MASLVDAADLGPILPTHLERAPATRTSEPVAAPRATEWAGVARHVGPPGRRESLHGPGTRTTELTHA